MIRATLVLLFAAAMTLVAAGYFARELDPRGSTATPEPPPARTVELDLAKPVVPPLADSSTPAQPVAEIATPNPETADAAPAGAQLVGAPVATLPGTPDSLALVRRMITLYRHNSGRE